MSHDAAGLAVYDVLLEMSPLPEKIELVEGGMAGLNLLPLLERGGRVVFVDAVAGFTDPGQIVFLTDDKIKGAETPDHFDHEAGLAYLLTILPKVCEGALPEEIVLVGLEGACTTQIIEQAAKLCVSIATNGMQDIK